METQEIVRGVLKHSYAGVFAAVLAEQIGLPVPSVAVLLAAGALVGAGKLNFAWALVLALTASLLGDLVWFLLGIHKGKSVLALLCRISLEPDSCVRQTENVYGKYGVWSLVLAKFVPGLSTIAPPMVGMFGLSWWRFLVFDGLGAVLWGVAYMGAGWLFESELARLASYSMQMGSWLLAVLIALLGLFIAVKYWQRRRMFRQLGAIVRIPPETVQERLAGGDAVVLLDVRNPLDGPGDKIPGAVVVSLDDLELESLPFRTDRGMIFYCW